MNSERADLGRVGHRRHGHANQVINSNVTFAGGLTLSITGADTFGGQLGGGASGNNFNLTMTGRGTLVLTGTNNTYSGQTNDQRRHAQLRGLRRPGRQPARSCWATRAASGEFSYTGGSLGFTRGFTVNASGGGQIDNSGSGLLTVSGSITGSGPLTLSGAANTTVSGPILTGGTLTKIGAGTLFLTSTASNFNGVSLAGGVLNFSASALTSVSSSAFKFSGGTLQWATGNTQDISAKIGISSSSQTAYLDTNGNNVAFATIIGGSGGLTKIGAGTLTSNLANTFSGALNLNGGVFATSSINTVGGRRAWGKVTPWCSTAGRSNIPVARAAVPTPEFSTAI